MRGLGVVIPVASVAQGVKAGHVDLREFGCGRIHKIIVHAQTGDIESLRTVVIEVRKPVEAVPESENCRWIDGKNTIHRGRIHATQETPTGLCGLAPPSVAWLQGVVSCIAQRHSPPGSEILI